MTSSKTSSQGSKEGSWKTTSRCRPGPVTGLTVGEHAAGIRSGQSGYGVEERRLTAAARTDYADDLAGRDPHRDINERIHGRARCAEPFRHPFDDELARRSGAGRGVRRIVIGARSSVMAPR